MEQQTYVFGVCKAEELDKIEVNCKVKKYEAGKKSKNILKSAKSVIVVGNLITKEIDVCKKGILGDDFPSYSNAKLKATEIADKLKRKGFSAKVNVGISIKNACMLSGIGVFGKNSLIIHPEYGTMLRFAAVITDWIPEEYGKPLEDFSPCKDCDACIKACKHSCLMPYVIDGPKCFCKYIEKGQKLSLTIPMCSDCQDVCPCNAFIKEKF